MRVSISAFFPFNILLLFPILFVQLTAIFGHKLQWRSNQIEPAPPNANQQISGGVIGPSKPVETNHSIALYCPPCAPGPNQSKDQLEYDNRKCTLKKRTLPNEQFRMHKFPIKIGKKRRNCCCCNPCTSTCCCPCCNCHWPCCGCSCQCGCCKKCCCCCCKPCCCCCKFCCDCGGGGRRRRRRRNLSKILRESFSFLRPYVRRSRRQIEFNGGGGDGHWHGDEEERKRR